MLQFNRCMQVTESMHVIDMRGLEHYMAASTGLTFYDSAYVVAAERGGPVLATDDAEMSDVARRRGIPTISSAEAWTDPVRARARTAAASDRGQSPTGQNPAAHGRPPFSSGASPGAGRGAAPAGSVAGNGRFLSPSRSRLRDNGAIAGFAQYGGGRRNRRRRLKRRAVIRSEAGPPARAGRAQPGRALNRGRAGRSGADPQASGSKTSCKAKARSRRALRRRVSGRPARKPAAAPGPALFPGGRAPTCWQARAPFSVRSRLGAEPDPGPVRIVPRH